MRVIWDSIAETGAVLQRLGRFELQKEMCVHLKSGYLNQQNVLNNRLNRQVSHNCAYNVFSWNFVIPITKTFFSRVEIYGKTKHHRTEYFTSARLTPIYVRFMRAIECCKGRTPSRRAVRLVAHPDESEFDQSQAMRSKIDAVTLDSAVHACVHVQWCCVRAERGLSCLRQKRWSICPTL